MTIGEKIRALRKENRHSQQDLADALGIERGNISIWENEKAKPQTGNIQALAKLYKVGVSYFLDDNTPIAPTVAGDKMNPDRALLVALLDEVATMKAKTDGISYEDAKSSLKKKASLILDRLDSWLPDQQ